MQDADLLNKLEAVRFKAVIDVDRSRQGGCTGCAKPAETVETLVQINRSVQRRSPELNGFEHHELPANPCELHWDNSFVIDPDGGVFKCPAVAGRPEMAVADVMRSSLPKLAPLLQLRPWEQCGDCAYMPVCVGGCLGGKYLQTGRTDPVDCRKEQFESTFAEAIPRRYLAELRSQEWETMSAAT